MKIYKDLEQMLQPCKCGGKVELIGGTKWEQSFSIYCSKCGGKWFMNTYSPYEAAQQWGVNKQRELTYSDCPTCKHMVNSNCKHKYHCYVEIDVLEECRVGTPSHWQRRETK